MVTVDFITNRHFAACGILESTEPLRGSTWGKSKVLVASSATHPTDMDDNGKNRRRGNGVPSFINPITGRLTSLAWAVIIFAVVFIFYSIMRQKRGGGFANEEEQAKNPKIQLGRRPGVDTLTHALSVGGGAEFDIQGVHLPNILKDDADDAPTFPNAPAIKHAMPAPKPKEFPVNLIYEPDVGCPDKPYVLFLVTTSPGEVLARTATRRTWGNEKGISTAVDLSMSWRTVFVMGRTEDKGDQIKRESTHYHDILQGQFEDLKSEETRKVMMGFQFAANGIPTTCQPKYVFKTTARVYMHVPLVIEWIVNKLKSAPNLYVGKQLRDDHPIRDKLDPLYVPRADYPGNVFPTMARGPLYMISMNVVQKMVAKFGQVTPIAMEDAYVGLLAARVGVSLKDDDHFVLIQKPSNFCHYHNMMFVFDLEPTEVMHIYNFVEQKHRISECGHVGF